MKETVAVIPARMGSTRFPGKPLAALAGRPMIEHVYRRAKLCKALSAVYVATCDREIARAAEAFGAPVLMTSPRHERASDRVAEAAKSLKAPFVVMIQGDEPLITPDMIEKALAPLLKDPRVLVSNLAAPITDEREFKDPNCIKTVMGANGDALYFSRSPIPSLRLPFARLKPYKQVCVIPFRRDFLLRFARLAPTPLEAAESIDMLRAMEHGYPVRLVPGDFASQSVDTPRDLAKASRLLAGASL